MKQAWVVLMGVLAGLTLQVAAQETPPLQFTFVGEQRIPTGTIYQGTGFGGISGITYDARNKIYYAMSDDRGLQQPIRFYTMELDFDSKSFPSLNISSFVAIQRDDGIRLGENGADPEGIAFVPSSGTLIWASEMSKEEGEPSVREMSTDGRFIRDFTVPDYYIPDGSGFGVYDNTSFESVGLSPDGQKVFAATESSLMQDGPVATLEKGSLSRILVFDFTSGKAIAEYAYETGPIPHAAIPASGSQDNGLSDLLVLDNHTLLTLERSFAEGVGNTINVYSVDLLGATNLLGQSIIQDMTYTPAAKTLVLTINEGDFGLNIDNIEGMTFGPVKDNLQTVVFVSDNNFNPRTQPYTQFLLFTLNRIVEGSGQ